MKRGAILPPVCLLGLVGLLAVQPTRAFGEGEGAAVAGPAAGISGGAVDEGLVYVDVAPLHFAEPATDTGAAALGAATGAESGTSAVAVVGAAANPSESTRSVLLAESLGEAMAAALGAAGFRTSEVGRVGGAPAALEGARSAGAAWAAALSLQASEGKAHITIAIYEAGSANLVAAEYLATSSGPTSLALIDAAAGRAVTRLSSFRAWRAGGGAPVGRAGALVAVRGGLLEDEAALALSARLLSTEGIRFVAFARRGPKAILEDAWAASCRLTLEVEAGASTVPKAKEFSLTWTINDTAGSRLPAKGSEVALEPDSATLAAAFWSPLTREAEDFLGTALPPILLRVSGQAGTSFETGRVRTTLPVQGFLTLELADTAPLYWRAEEVGAYAESGRIRPSSTSVSLGIPRHLLGVEFGAYGLGFPELRLVLALGGRGFVRAGFSGELAGLDFSSIGSPAFIVSRPLITARLGGGLTLAPRSSDIHPYLALDLTNRLVLATDFSPTLDARAPFGLEPILGLDWGRGPKFRVWAELGLTLYPWAEPARFYASLGGRPSLGLLFGGPSLFAGHPGWLAELPLLRVGMRVGI